MRLLHTSFLELSSSFKWKQTKVSYFMACSFFAAESNAFITSIGWFRAHWMTSSYALPSTPSHTLVTTGTIPSILHRASPALSWICRMVSCIVTLSIVISL